MLSNILLTLWSHSHIVFFFLHSGRVITSLKMKVKVSQSCPTLCNPMDYTVHGILQARILKWVACSSFRGSPQLRDQIQVSCIAGGFFTSWATREAQEHWSGWPIPSLEDLPDQELSWGLLHCRRILYQLSYKGSLIISLTLIKWPPCVYVFWSVTCWFLLKLTLGLFMTSFG